MNICLGSKDCRNASMLRGDDAGAQCSAYNSVDRSRVAVGGFMGKDRQGFGRLDWCAIAAGFICCYVASAGTPVPTYGTYFGGTGDINAAVAVAVDSSGNVIVAGYTTSQTLPGTANAFQPTKASGGPENRDIFVAKFNQSGSTLLWTTFLGGAGDDVPTAIAVDSAGAIYLIGTASPDFPITSGAYLGSASSGTGFAAKVSPDGTSLLYSTFLPGVPNAFAISNSGEAIITGIFSASALTAGALGNSSAAGDQGAGGISLLHLNSTGKGLIFGAYLGGGGFNGSKATSVALDPQGNAYVAGYTGESNILTTPNAFQAQPSGSTGFVIKVNPTGSQLVYGTYFAPQYSSAQITSIVVTANGSFYLSGLINTAALWATQGAYLSTPSPGFVAKLTPGSLVLDSFSYIPSSSSFPPLLALGSPPATLYVSFGTQQVGPIGFSVVELSAPSLALVSSFSSPSQGFALLGSALGGSHSLWLVGLAELGSLCPTCSLGNLVSSNAFESTPPSPNGENAVLLQLNDIAPAISFLGSAATGSSPFTAGQLVSIYGTQLGPTPGSSGQENSSGVVTSSNGGTQVLFDGVAAPILYTGASQVNTVIPCSTAGRASTQMVVQYLGAQSPLYTVALNPAAPGIFTSNGSGSGQAVALNQDYSLNGPSNPAARGSAVFFYATGIGPTSPCVDGLTYQSNFPVATLPVVAGVGNLGAQVLYAGQAPSFISGVAQINIVIPSGSPTGVVPLSLLVDGVFSPPGVTIAVK
jgi:uncharacterized protein (TIGR03437 family)